ncbi:hypothetical protein [Corynebacterium guaraldiae]|uniref:hypothetical protein n=1 Tax=Corynebacterium guaraldiae TaxID=3051103 RepID=UPI00163D95F2|nr:hypothetical protein [Corynebacterium guaraldiae]
MKARDIVSPHPHAFQPLDVAIRNAKGARPHGAAFYRFGYLLRPCDSIGVVAISVAHDCPEMRTGVSAAAGRRCVHKRMLIRHSGNHLLLKDALHIDQGCLFSGLTRSRLWDCRHLKGQGNGFRLNIHQLRLEAEQLLLHDARIGNEVCTRLRNFTNFLRCACGGFTVVLGFQRRGRVFKTRNDFCDFPTQSAPPRIRFRHIPEARAKQIRC